MDNILLIESEYIQETEKKNSDSFFRNVNFIKTITYFKNDALNFWFSW